LIDTIQTGFGVSEEDLVVRHPLQAYSKRYFNEREASLFSYSGENLLAAADADSTSGPPPFFDRPLSGLSSEFDTLRLEELCQFFSHPVRYLARKRLNIRIEEPKPMLEDKENFRIDALGHYQMKQTLLSAIFSGHKLREFFSIVRAEGDLPQGTVGRVLYGQLECEAKHFAEEVAQILKGESADTLKVDLTVAGFNLIGSLTGVYPNGRVQVRFARRTAKDWLTVWIYHLVLSALKGKEPRFGSTLLDTDGTVYFQPVKHPKTYLNQIVKIYQEGMRRPLHFFPELSLRFVQLVKNDAKDPDAALQTIQNLWLGSDYKKGISQDPYHRRCFGETNPFDEEFKNLAEMVFVPILRSSERWN
jgi:exodeoxyribonuclease V gamma subunit